MKLNAQIIFELQEEKERKTQEYQAFDTAH